MLAATLIVVAGGTVPVIAQDQAEMRAQFGAMTYRLFCVGCHGVDGHGNRAVQRALALPPVDLTTITQRNGGIFPTEEVAHSITGLGDTGHARAKMAPWADVFAEEFRAFASAMVVDEMVARRIDHLVAYIKSIQDE